MTSIITTQSVSYGVPAVDGRGRPVMMKTKFNGREVEVQAADIVRVGAGRVLTVGEHITADQEKDFIKAGLARKHDPVLDGEGDESPVEAAEASRPTDDTSKDDAGKDPLS